MIGATFKMTACAPHDKMMAPMTSVMKWAYATILEKATTKVNAPPTAKPAIVSLIPDFSLLIEWLVLTFLKRKKNDFKRS